MSEPSYVLLEAQPTIEIVEILDPKTLTVSETEFELLDVGIQGPPGPPGPEAQMAADPLAYYILAKN